MQEDSEYNLPRESYTPWRHDQAIAERLVPPKAWSKSLKEQKGASPLRRGQRGPCGCPPSRTREGREDPHRVRGPLNDRPDHEQEGPGLLLKLPYMRALAGLWPFVDGKSRVRSSPIRRKR